MERNKSIVWMSAIIFALFSCRATREPLGVVDSVDLQQYAGTWYEIARLPNRFERGLKCVTATYELREDGKIQVINRGHPIAKPGQVKTSAGIARVVDPDEPARLKVTFFWPFSGKYWIIDLARDYSYALVGTPSRKYLWILSRSPDMDRQTYQYLMSLARTKGFDTTHMIRTLQDCDAPP